MNIDDMKEEQSFVLSKALTIKGLESAIDSIDAWVAENITQESVLQFHDRYRALMTEQLEECKKIDNQEEWERISREDKYSNLYDALKNSAGKDLWLYSVSNESGKLIEERSSKDEIEQMNAYLEFIEENG